MWSVARSGIPSTMGTVDRPVGVERASGDQGGPGPLGRGQQARGQRRPDLLPHRVVGGVGAVEQGRRALGGLGQGIGVGRIGGDPPHALERGTTTGPGHHGDLVAASAQHSGRLGADRAGSDDDVFLAHIVSPVPITRAPLSYYHYDTADRRQCKSGALVIDQLVWQTDDMTPDLPARASTTARAIAREQLTRAILEKAREQLATVGPAQLSVRAVAREVGMVSSAVYRYFPSRDELLTELLVICFDELGHQVETGRGCGRGPHRLSWPGGWPWPTRYARLGVGPPVRLRAALRLARARLCRPGRTVGPASRVTRLVMALLRDQQRAGGAPPAAAADSPGPARRAGRSARLPASTCPTSSRCSGCGPGPD